MRAVDPLVGVVSCPAVEDEVAFRPAVVLEEEGVLLVEDVEVSPLGVDPTVALAVAAGVGAASRALLPPLLLWCMRACSPSLFRSSSSFSFASTPVSAIFVSLHPFSLLSPCDVYQFDRIGQK